MLKVYLDAGLEDRLEAVIGEYLTEDEKYLILRSNSIRRKIPHRRIVHIEDLSEVIVTESEPVELVPKASVQPEQPSPGVPRISPGKPLNMAEMRQKLREGRRQGNIPELTIEEEEQAQGNTFINVVITGAENKTLSLEMPEASFTPNQYSASLAKELSKNQEIKSLLDRGIVFDGPPDVVGKNIYVKTKTLVEKVTGVSQKMELVGALHNAGKKFMQPEKAYQTEFSMSAKTDLGGIPHNPFDAPVMIESLKPPISSEVVVERMEEGGVDESSSEEGGDGEERNREETPEGNEGVFEESTGD